MFHPPRRLAEIALFALIGLFCWSTAFGTESDKPEPAQEIEIPVELIQSALKFLGHYAGPQDGKLGKDTRTALGRWQESAGLEATGELLPDQALALIQESATAGLAEAQALLETLDISPEPPPPSDQERLNTLETTLEGFDQRMKTAGDGIEANSQGLADLGSRLDSELEKVDTVALRLDSFGAQLDESNQVLEAQKSRLEDNSIKLYETLIRIDSAKKDLSQMRRAYDRMRSYRTATATADAAEAGTEKEPLGFLLPLVLCLLVPLAVVIYQGGFQATTDGTEQQIRQVAWILVTWFAGGAAFVLIGFGVMYGPSLGGMVGDFSHFFSTMMLSALEEFPPEMLALLIPNLILASIVAVVASSSVPRRITNRGHFLVALVAGGIIYPLFGHWIAMPTDISDQSGWLAGAAFECPSATINVALLGGVLALSLASGLGLIRAGAIAGAARPLPPNTGTTGAMLLWVAWMGVILISSGDCVDPSVLLLALSAAAGGAALGVLVVDGATAPSLHWQNRLPFAVLAGVVAAPVGAQEASFIELAALGAITGVSASLLMRYFDKRSTTDVRLAVALLAGGLFGAFGPALFGSGGFLFVRSFDVLTPQLPGIGAALLLGLLAGRVLALAVKMVPFLRART